MDSDEETTIKFPTDSLDVRMRVEALQQMVVLAGSERGPDAVKFDDLKVWIEDTAKFLHDGVWPARPAAKLKKIEGGKGGTQTPASEQVK